MFDRITVIMFSQSRALKKVVSSESLKDWYDYWENYKRDLDQKDNISTMTF